MAVHNAEVAALFYRMAELLEIEGANPFRVRAYRRAAATIEDLTQPVADLVAAGADLDQLPGIGEDLAGKIEEICATGKLQALAEVEARTPSALAALAAVPGLGPKRVKILHDALGVTSVDDLVRAAEAGQVQRLPKFGPRFEAKLLGALRKPASPEPKRWRISTAEDFGAPLVRFLRTTPGVRDVVIAGSYRRRKDTVGDLDILATSDEGAVVTDRFVHYDEVSEVLAHGPTRATVLMGGGLQVDLRVVPEESFGAALVYFTGSKAHNIALRGLAQDKGLKINEYGVFRGKARIAGRTEAEVYAAVGLPLIPPELREDRGEIAAGFKHSLPRLVEMSDIRGDLHVHTRASDGKNTLEEMVEAAAALGYEYLAIADHSQHATVANGLDAGRLSAQIDEIDRLNESRPGIRILKSCEVDILPSGKLDMPEAVLRRLDFVIGAIHSGFELPGEAQTERVLRAMDNRCFDILAHPVGRLIGERPGYAVDLPRVMAGAAARGCHLEINAHPSRLDLDDVQARAAREMGLKIAIGSDAHSTSGLRNLRFGLGQARRAWLEPEDVLNARSWPELAPLLKR